MLPLDPDGSTLAMACGSGVLLCKLLCTCQPDAIDERVLNLPEGGAAELATPERLQNVTLCLNAASSLGASVSHIDAAKVADGQEEAVLECLWQIVRLHKLQDINLKSFPSLLALQQEDEQLPALLEVAPEALLLRWLNHHLRQPLSHWRRAPITSLDAGVQDGQAYLCLVQQLQPGSVDVAALLREADPAARASAILSAAQQLTGAAVLPPPAGLLGPNQRLHCLMLSELFHACPALQLSQAERIEQRQALSWLEEGDVDASREERTFRMWLNSLLPDAHVSSLYGETLRDGWILLQAIAHIRPGSVDFARVHRPPFPNPLHRRPKSLENCNLVVQLTKDLLHLPLINVGGLDILNGQRKIILAILYQLMRLHTHALLQRIRPADAQLADAQMDVEILSWANQTVAAMGNTHLQISSFADPSLSSGQFLITLLAAVIPGMVKPALVTPGVSAADKTLNAKYAISLARKLGCSIFLLWEDIVEVKPKMIAIFVASLMVHAARTPAAH
ncbi:hypothetical protein WJX72_009729 [[Myrmecia] bisecta]|uniref:Calponin-homology (CH) domain-containing protein n=1 Tax=[Myrmecia] bisecta TaxID=41462 RepID=A0AAW1R958_9CHLO